MHVYVSVCGVSVWQDISDDSFLRRHKKYEEDEKRRKRLVL